MSRLASLSLWLLTLGALAGCPYGNGAVCEINSDCASTFCCGASPSSGVRGVCTEIGECGISRDSGIPDTPDAPSADEDAPEPLDTGVDAPEDSGVDAPEEDDAGLDAGLDAGDAGGDAGLDASTDTGVDAPT